jgi:hypothetical protein
VGRTVPLRKAFPQLPVSALVFFLNPSGRCTDELFLAVAESLFLLPLTKQRVSSSLRGLRLLDIILIIAILFSGFALELAI